MADLNAFLADSLIIAGLLMELQKHTGESYVAGLKRIFPNLSDNDAEAIANDAMLAEERAANEALPDA